MIVEALNALVDLHYDFVDKTDGISRENVKALLAMYYSNLWKFEDCEYVIGKNNKDLSLYRKESEKIWKQRQNENYISYDDELEDLTIKNY